MTAQECRNPREKFLFLCCAILSGLVWLALVISLVGLVYGLLIGLFLLVAHALFIAHVRGHGVKLSANQLPDLHARVVRVCQSLGLARVPDTYVMQAGGMLNAFATKFIGRTYVIIYSDLIESCGEDDQAIDMIIGHEVGHLALGHLKWLMFLLPAQFTPWLGAAYSRAREYSCDRCGLEAVNNLEAAARGLVVLAAGGKLSRQVNLRTFVGQMEENRGFWGSVYELNASHPYLPKRIAALANARKPGTFAIPGRSILAYPLAPFLGFGGAGAASSGIVVIAIIGILAAIAIPQFKQYQARAAAANLESAEKGSEEVLMGGKQQADAYLVANGSFPCSSEELAYPDFDAYAARMGWETEVNCQDNYLAYFYQRDGKRHFKAILLDSAEIRQGVLDQ